MKNEPVDFVHTGPGTLAGRYLRMFWQPVYRSEDLSQGRAVPIRIMSENFTLYRGESGRAAVVAFRCAHRGTQLSTGWVEGDSIRCRYHGWRYDGSGQCVEQPGEEEGFAAKVKIRSYPTEEYLGLIFAYLGEGEPPPFRRFADFEREGFRKVGLPEYWPCNYFNRLENAVDGAHVAFTHRESARRVNRPDRSALRKNLSEETQYGIKTSMMVPEKPTEYVHFHMPNINQPRAQTRIEGSLKDAATLWTDRLFWYVPVDDESSVTFVVDLLPLTGEAAREYQERQLKAQSAITVSPNELSEAVLQGKMTLHEIDPNLSTYYLFWVEDYVTMVGQGAIANRSNDRLGREDGGVVYLRKIWERELAALAQGRAPKEWIEPPSGLLAETAMSSR